LDSSSFLRFPVVIEVWVSPSFSCSDLQHLAMPNMSSADCCTVHVISPRHR
jgi:hypothetical protein